MPSRFSAERAVLAQRSAIARRARVAGTLGVVAGLATLLVYRETLQYGFDYDDYHFIRPYALDEVLAAFHRTWDVSEIEAPFYRPLTVAFFALRFELFGLNATAHHALSLAMFAAVAALTAAVAYRFTLSRMAAVLAAILFASHPTMPYSLAAWVTNQMHLLQALTVAAAILCWWTVRHRSPVWWLPLCGFAVISFLIKEDGLMLLPAIIALHWLSRWLEDRPAPPISWRWLALVVVLLSVLVAVRAASLGGLGGYGRPAWERAWPRIWTALHGVFLLTPADRPWQVHASWFATALLAVPIAAWKWTSRGARHCFAAGLTIAVLFALPFAFAAKPEQVYMLGAGASLALTGGALSVRDLVTRLSSTARWVSAGLATIAVAAGLASFVAVTRDITRDFEPFGPIVLAHDDVVRTWAAVPPELREYLARKREPGMAGRMSSNPVDELTVATFGVHPREITPDGVHYVWMARPRIEIDILAPAREVGLPLRHAIEALREPTTAHISADGRRVDDIQLDTPQWRTANIALREKDRTRIGRSHRIQITLDHAWRPSEIIPGSTDTRILGLQIGEPRLR